MGERKNKGGERKWGERGSDRGRDKSREGVRKRGEKENEKRRDDGERKGQEEQRDNEGEGKKVLWTFIETLHFLLFIVLPNPKFSVRNAVYFQFS